MHNVKKVLIVDDDESVAVAIETYLEMEFDEDIECNTFTTHSCGTEALNWLRDNKPDWAILDLLLNGVNGFQIINSINDKYDDIPILIITGCAQDSDEIIKATKLSIDPSLNIRFATKRGLTDTLEVESEVLNL